MLYTAVTRKSLAALREDLPRACAAHQFGVLSILDLKEKMKEKGVAYDGECLIFEVCNPHKARQALDVNPEISTALPCRISAYRTRDGTTRLSTIRPDALLAMFKADSLKEMAADIDRSLVAIIDEAARSKV